MQVPSSKPPAKTSEIRQNMGTSEFNDRIRGDRDVVKDVVKVFQANVNMNGDIYEKQPLPLQRVSH